MAHGHLLRVSNGHGLDGQRNGGAPPRWRARPGDVLGRIRPQRHGHHASRRPAAGVQPGAQRAVRSGRGQRQEEDGRCLAAAVVLLARPRDAPVSDGVLLRGQNLARARLRPGHLRARGFLREMERLLAHPKRVVPVHAFLLPGGGQAAARDVQLGFFPLCQRAAQLVLRLWRTPSPREGVRVGLARPGQVRRGLARLWVHRRGDLAELQPVPPTPRVLAVHVRVAKGARGLLAGLEVVGTHPGEDARVSQAGSAPGGHPGVRRGGGPGDDAAGEQARHRRRRGDDGGEHRHRRVGRRGQRHVLDGHRREGRVPPRQRRRRRGEGLLLGQHRAGVRGARVRRGVRVAVHVGDGGVDHLRRNRREERGEGVAGGFGRDHPRRAQFAVHRGRVQRPRAADARHVPLLRGGHTAFHRRRGGGCAVREGSDAGGCVPVPNGSRVGRTDDCVRLHIQVGLAQALGGGARQTEGEMMRSLRSRRVQKYMCVEIYVMILR
mmetsp:Transcript_6958/g.27324  ORF Transcript_6958/g.27324 Transcript_6958/m.27324 type:complete len:493 (+) Transcript_6958:278-1756(+)